MLSRIRVPEARTKQESKINLGANTLQTIKCLLSMKTKIEVSNPLREKRRKRTEEFVGSSRGRERMEREGMTSKKEVKVSRMMRAAAKI